VVRVFNVLHPVGVAAQRSYSVLQVSADMADGHINYGTYLSRSLFTAIKIQIELKLKLKINTICFRRINKLQILPVSGTGTVLLSHRKRNKVRSSKDFL
jgi:hypothetical protein